jgi:hypothetical protein
MPDGRAYIVMEYVAVKTLKQLVEERGALDPAESGEDHVMAAEGMMLRIAWGSCHRDLKPEKHHDLG